MKIVKVNTIALILLSVLLTGLISVTTPAYAQERRYVFVGAWPYNVPPKGHFNTFVTYAITLGAYHQLIQEPLAFYIWYNDTYIPWLATSWEIKGDEFIVSLRKGVVWHNGDPFTSKDVVSTFYCLFLLKSPVWEYIDKVTAVDPNTVSFHISKPSIVLIRYVLREPIRPYSTYGNFSDKVIELLDQGLTWESEEIQSLLTEFRNYRPKEYIGTGPYMWTGELTESEVWLKKNPNHWNAKNIKFEWIKLYNGETPVVTPLVLGFKVDYATHGFPPATEMEFYKLGISVYRPPTGFGPAILFNHKIYPLNLTVFRRAIDYAINKTENAYVSLMYSAKRITVPSGLPLEIEERWILPEYRAEMTDYSYDPEKAAALLEGLGFEKGEDGIWRTPEGEPLEFELMFPAEFADWRAAAENAAAQLTAFGIPITLRAITFTEIQPKFVRGGDFEMAIQGWGTGNPHPHFSFYQAFIYYNFPGYAEPGYSYELTREIEGLGTVNLEELVYDCAEGFDVEAQKEIVSKLALAFNKDLPMVPLWERYGNNPVLSGVRVEGWPPAEHWIWTQSLYSDNPVVLMLATGLYLKPVGWTPPPVEKPVVPKELEEAVASLESAVESMRSDIDALSSSIEELNSKIATLSDSISGASSTASMAMGISVISLIAAIAAIVLARRRPEE